MAGLAKEVIKRAVLPALYRLGIFDLLVRLSKRDFVIVMYHGLNVTDADFRMNPRHIRERDFERHLRFFRRNFDVVPLRQVAEKLRRGERFRRKTLAITFDDGYRNNLAASEKARQFGLPMTVFIGTSVVKQPGTWHYADRVDFLVHTTRETELAFRGRRYPLGDTRSRRAAARAIYEQMKQEPAAGKTATLRELEEALKPEPGALDNLREFFTYLSEEDVRRMRDSGVVEIGSHGVDHYNLEYLSPPEAEFQLLESKRYLEEILQDKVRTVSYPDGSYNAETLRIVEKHFESACAVNPRLDRSGRNVYEMGRIGLSADDDFYVHLFHLVSYFWGGSAKSTYQPDRD